jgi:hypothetical protein
MSLRAPETTGVPLDDFLAAIGEQAATWACAWPSRLVHASSHNAQLAQPSLVRRVGCSASTSVCMMYAVSDWCTGTDGADQLDEAVLEYLSGYVAQCVEDNEV